MDDLRAFVIESNRIEGIHRRPKLTEIRALEAFVAADDIGQSELVALVGVFQPDARLRDRAGLDVIVGSHRPPPGGSGMPAALSEVLQRARDGEHPYLVHHAYETLHPFTDGNGRSGRALWLWGMRRRSDRDWRQALSIGFLHLWYYQSLGGVKGVAMSVTDDPTDPGLTRGADTEPVPQAAVYLMLSDAERAKGFVRPYREAYRHDTCGQVTTMSPPIAETFARTPAFYGATFCVHCSMHRPVGEHGEFTWLDNGAKVGT